VNSEPCSLHECVVRVTRGVAPVCTYPNDWFSSADELMTLCWLTEYLRKHPAISPREVTNDTDPDDPR
jgi:hypothetical protein